MRRGRWVRIREACLQPAAVRAATADDEAAAIAVIVLAFAADPVARWTWPQSHQYLAGMPRLVRAFAGNAFSHGGACCTEDLTGAALWLPPGIRPDEQRLAEVVQSTVLPSLGREVYTTFEEMAKYHPREPHWYLPMIGVDPAHQGKGHGDALMDHALRRCDHDRAPAYLESTNPRNMSLYLRHGFEARGTIQVGSSPTLVPMLRRPR
jgi:ribosomal protein S18 acetylase RimI-like enzyme